MAISVPDTERLRIFLDTEFTGLHQGAALISLGLVAENGKSFYAEFDDFDPLLVDEWCKENVMSNLLFGTDQWDSNDPKVDTRVYGSAFDVANVLTPWLESFDQPIEIWSDCLAYDWVLFCEIFGGALHIPSCVYYIPFDLSTLLLLAGEDPDVSRSDFVGVSYNQHNAVADARVMKMCFKRIVLLNTIS